MNLKFNNLPVCGTLAWLCTTYAPTLDVIWLTFFYGENFLEDEVLKIDGIKVISNVLFVELSY